MSEACYVCAAPVTIDQDGTETCARCGSTASNVTVTPAPDPIEQAARALIQRGEPIDTETLECFYCGSADPVMPWPDSGIPRIIHEPTCKWTNLRAALGDTKETPNKSRNARRPKPGGGAA